MENKAARNMYNCIFLLLAFVRKETRHQNNKSPQTYKGKCRFFVCFLFWSTFSYLLSVCHEHTRFESRWVCLFARLNIDPDNKGKYISICSFFLEILKVAVLLLIAQHSRLLFIPFEFKRHFESLMSPITWCLIYSTFRTKIVIGYKRNCFKYLKLNPYTQCTSERNFTRTKWNSTSI